MSDADQSDGEITQVKTSGVGSAVRDEHDSELGHVVMLDYDGVDYELALAEAQEIDGPAVVVRSSPGSWHVWGLRVRSWDAVENRMLRSAASSEFVSEMLERERCVLRTHPKLTRDNMEASPSPVPVTLLEDESDAEISKPHAIRLWQLAQLADSDEVASELAALLDSDRAIGKTLSSETWFYRGGRT